MNIKSYIKDRLKFLNKPKKNFGYLIHLLKFAKKAFYEKEDGISFMTEVAKPIPIKSENVIKDLFLYYEIEKDVKFYNYDNQFRIEIQGKDWIIDTMRNSNDYYLTKFSSPFEPRVMYYTCDSIEGLIKLIINEILFYVIGAKKL